jgi:hypothetical protein
MYEVISKKKVINRICIPTWWREIFDANIFEIEVGTNGYQGGDSGHGSRTYFRVKDICSSDINVKTLTDKFGDTTGVEVLLGGDSELRTFIEALEFALKVLKEESEHNKPVIREGED